MNIPSSILRMETVCSCETFVPPTSMHGIIAEKATVWTLNALENLNLRDVKHNCSYQIVTVIYSESQKNQTYMFR